MTAFLKSDFFKLIEDDFLRKVSDNFENHSYPTRLNDLGELIEIMQFYMSFFSHSI